MTPDPQAQPDRIGAQARVRMGVVAILAALAAVGLTLMAAMALFLLFGVKYHSAAYNGGRLLVTAVPLFAVATAVVAGIAARSGRRWAAWLGSIMFGLLVLPILVLTLYHFL